MPFRIFLVIFSLLLARCAYCADIEVASFDELINSTPQSGDTITFSDNLTSSSSIAAHFENLNITFDGNNFYIDGSNTFGGFILNREIYIMI